MLLDADYLLFMVWHVLVNWCFVIV